MNSIEALEKYFGYKSFRPGQAEIIDSIISGENVLAVLPTGAGKSICYQIPALLSKSFAIVISPLIALMKDQVDSLNKSEEIASFINSTLDYQTSEKVLQLVFNKKIKILYLSPEKLMNKVFVDKLKQLSPEFIFIDEAHCISEWGHNFRPSYRKIHEFIDYLGIKRVSAFTATATEEVREDILKQLSLSNPKIFVRGFERENLQLQVIATVKKKEKTVELIKNNKLPAIIYTATRSTAEELADFLRKEMINSVYYHAGLPSEMKRIIQDDFMSGRAKVICATNAFGMGIDKNDIRLVIHYNITGSIENYYQEIGRAGRDGKPAKVFLLYEERDRQIQEYFINSSSPSREQIEKIYDCICDYGKVALGMMSSNSISYDTALTNLFDSQQLTAGLVNSAAKVLNESGYIKLQSEIINQYQVRFPLNPEQLHSFIKNFAKATHKDILLLLAQSFGVKIFTNFYRVDNKYFSERLEVNEEEIAESLDDLARGGIIELIKPHKTPSFVLLQPRLKSKTLNLDLAHIQKVKKNLQHKLDIMEEYVSTNKCRMSFILNYFGQNSETYKCGKCDNCTEGNLNATADYLEEIILRTLHEAKRPLRTKTLIQILHGSSTLGSLNKFSSFGACVHFEKKQIEDSLQQLLVNKLILINNDMLKLSDNSLKFFIEDNLEKAKSELVDYEEELKLFNKLRQIRKEASEKFAQQPHLICNDEILRAIAKIKPQSHSALLSIAGFSQRMFNKIGDEILTATRSVSLATITEKDITKRNLPNKVKLILDLIEKKYSLEDIAELAKVSESLLSIQLENLISMIPDLDISNLIKPEELTLINKKIDEGITEVKELKKQLDGRISYAKIRLVLAKRNFS